jgi:hypothetical protein
MTNAARLAALAGGSILAVFAATRWLDGEGGAPGDVGRVEIRDVLVARDAEVRAGLLAGCDATRCELDGRLFDRSSLAFVGLGVETATPPAIEDPSRDELHLRGGGVVHEPLARIDDEAVFAGARRFERGEVTWVYLAVAAEAERPGPQGTEEAPRPPVRTPRPAGDPLEPCPEDRPLGGSIELEVVYTRERFYRCDQKARLWFGLIPMGQGPWPSELGSPHHSDAIRYELSSSGCSDMPDPHGEVCTAPEEARSGRVDFGPIGPLGVANQSGGVTFYPTDPALDFQLLDEISDWRIFQIQCVLPGGGGTSGLKIRLGGSVRPWGPDECEIGPCVAPGACYRAEDALRRDCVLHPDRYAVIPFEGSETRRLMPGVAGLNSGEFKDVTTRWRVCCGCGEPPSEARSSTRARAQGG